MTRVDETREGPDRHLDRGGSSPREIRFLNLVTTGVSLLSPTVGVFALFPESETLEVQVKGCHTNPAPRTVGEPLRVVFGGGREGMTPSPIGSEGAGPLEGRPRTPTLEPSSLFGGEATTEDKLGGHFWRPVQEDGPEDSDR